MKKLLVFTVPFLLTGCAGITQVNPMHPLHTISYMKAYDSEVAARCNNSDLLIANLNRDISERQYAIETGEICIEAFA